MSGVVITASGVDASTNNIGLVLPYASNCEAFGILGGTVARSQKNYAAGKTDFTLVGSPTLSDHSAEFQNTVSWLQTAVAETDNMTLIAVCSTEKQNAFLVSNYGTVRTGSSPSQYPLGANLRTTAQGTSTTTNFLTATAGYYDGTTNGTANAISASLTRTAATGYRCAAARFTESSGVVKINDLTAGDNSSATRPSGSRDKAPSSFRVGSAILSDATRNDAVDILGFAIYSETLSDANLALVYNWFKTYYARRGISI
jgi:hypothetical protein